MPTQLPRPRLFCGTIMLTNFKFIPPMSYMVCKSVLTNNKSIYLSLPRDEFSMKIIDDIGNVQPQEFSISTSKTLTIAL